MRIINTLIVIFLNCLFLNVKGQTCPVLAKAISIYNWNPSNGAIANYTANVIDSDKDALGLIIILGKTDNGVYTIESGEEDNAEGNGSADLVFRSFDGNTKSYELYKTADISDFSNEEDYSNQLKKKIINSLKQYENEKVFTIDSLMPTHYLRNKKSDNSEWSLRIKNNVKNKILSWKLQSASMGNCWCSYGWKCTLLELKE